MEAVVVVVAADDDYGLEVDNVVSNVVDTQGGCFRDSDTDDQRNSDVRIWDDSRTGNP